MGDNGQFKKGHKGGPGRHSIVLKEVQDMATKARNELKTIIIERVSPNVEQWIDRIIEQGVAEGDVVKFKMLLELGLGKLVNEQPEFEVSDEEQILVLEYRRRKKEQLERDLSGTVELPQRAPGDDSETKVRPEQVPIQGTTSSSD